MVVVVVVVVVGGGLVGRGGGLTHASDKDKLIPGKMWKWKYIKSMIMDASSVFTKNDEGPHPRLDYNKV